MSSYDLGIAVLVLIIALVFGSLAMVLVKRWRHATSTGPLSPKQFQLSVMIGVLFVGAITYRLLVWGRFEQTSALFIGLPTLLAFIVVLSPKAESVTGMILKGITIALLMSGILLGEGFICIVMSAPLFYLVGVIIGLFADRSRRRGNRINRVMILPFLIMSFEGVSSVTSFNRAQTVMVEKKVAANNELIITQLAKKPDFSTPLPFYLRAGFPRPTESNGSGLKVGDLRDIRFAGGEGNPGNLTMRVASASNHEVVFEKVSDTSHIAHWLDWKRSKVEILKVSENESLVRWTIEYDRRLDPAWYFAPWQRYAVGLATEYLVDSLATPRMANGVQ